MTATFLVEVELPDISPAVLIDEAETMAHDLTSMGVEVVSVKPWARPGMTLPTPGTPQPPAI